MPGSVLHTGWAAFGHGGGRMRAVAAVAASAVILAALLVLRCIFPYFLGGFDARLSAHLTVLGTLSVLYGTSKSVL